MSDLIRKRALYTTGCSAVRDSERGWVCSTLYFTHTHTWGKHLGHAMFANRLLAKCTLTILPAAQPHLVDSHLPK